MSKLGKECSAPKSCALDPIPSKLLIECIDSILPSPTDLFNSSHASGIFPQCIKSALVTSILKNRCLDHNDLNSYRPVSDLCFILGTVFIKLSQYLFGHALNIAMLKPNDDIVCSTTVTLLPSSDYYCVDFDISVVQPVNHAEIK